MRILSIIGMTVDGKVMRNLAVLSETQRRRLKMLFEDKLSYREIARREGVNYSSVVESIGAAARRLAPLMDGEITSLPDFAFHYGPHHKTEDSEDSSFKEKKKVSEKHPIKPASKCPYIEGDNYPSDRR